VNAARESGTAAAFRPAMSAEAARSPFTPAESALRIFLTIAVVVLMSGAYALQIGATLR
jgi:hypothetical protein